MAENAIEKSNFTVRDTYSSSAVVSSMSSIANDASHLTETANTSWLGVTAKSSKTCEKIAGIAPGQLVRCSDVNSHYYRDFSTDSDSEDRQFSMKNWGKTMKIFGFF